MAVRIKGKGEFSEQ